MSEQQLHLCRVLHYILMNTSTKQVSFVCLFVCYSISFYSILQYILIIIMCNENEKKKKITKKTSRVIKGPYLQDHQYHYHAISI